MFYVLSCALNTHIVVEARFASLRRIRRRGILLHFHPESGIVKFSPDCMVTVFFLCLFTAVELMV